MGHLGEAGRRIFFLVYSCFLGIHFLNFVYDFCGFGSEHGANLDGYSAEKLLCFLIDFPKVVQLGPEGSRILKDTKMEPNGAKMEPRGLPN